MINLESRENYGFPFPADRMKNIPRSGIREILMAAEGRPMISFGGGVPHDSCVPLPEIRDAFEAVFTNRGARAFRYGTTEGEKELREYVASWLKGLGLQAGAGEILIVNGSQQGLDLLGKVLLNPGSTILVERPTYLAALQAFSPYEPQYDEVEMDDQGAIVESLKEKLRKPSTFFYTIPSFQNPSGVCISVKRREEIVNCLNETGCLLIEDDPYGQLYYDSPPPAPLCAMGVKNAVYLGTFSKMVSPGFRLGWMWTSDKNLMKHLITVKQAADLCTGLFQQYLLLEVLRRLDIHKHLECNRIFYATQREKMNQYMSNHLSGLMDWNYPSGGMFFWAALKNGLHAGKLLSRCVERGVAFADGASFFAGEKDFSRLRLNFTQYTEEEMDRGLLIIAEEIRQMPIN